MEFRILGPVEVRADDQRIDIGHARQRSVLAVLLLDLGQVVPAERLIDRVWGEDPPASVRNVLYGCVAKLKAALARAQDPHVRLARRSGGYLLEADHDQVDLCRFRRQVGEAAMTGDDEQAAALLRTALGLWQGPALAGLDSPWLSGMRDSLELRRMAAVLDLNDIALRQGRHGALIGELTEAAAAYPADERLIGQLMLALYRSGQQAEALRWFERTRQRLAGELGADPTPRLRTLHQQILRADPVLAAPELPRHQARPGTALATAAGAGDLEEQADAAASLALSQIARAGPTTPSGPAGAAPARQVGRELAAAGPLGRQCRPAVGPGGRISLLRCRRSVSRQRESWPGRRPEPEAGSPA
jgi:DNA-binding SARP family transcriptional activator